MSIEISKKSPLVVVGLSGGVDSAVSALLLKQQGYNVVGLFMRNWDSFVNNEDSFLENNKICSQETDYNDALKVAKQLNIKLYRVDFIKEYWNEVFIPFINAYKKSITPNPDIFCNKFIKFKYFTSYAFSKLKADYVATGHYAKIIKKNNQNFLALAVDKDKDQTYFLSSLNSSQLDKIIFPLQNIIKKDVRKIALENNLVVANKKDSTGICFIGKRKIKDFLLNYIDKKTGFFVEIESKKILGKHDGTMFYTIGQRFGLNIGGLKEPVFVCDKDIKKNIIYVAYSTNQDVLISTSSILEEVSWINDVPKPGKYLAKFKHSPKFSEIEIIKFFDNKRIEISYSPKKAVTPGQNCVIYKNNICLGQGIIASNKKL